MLFCLIFSYFVVDHANNSDTKWWNSEKDQAGCIDFTNPSASEWFETRLKQLQEEAGIDSFKFDAGETGWSPNVSEAEFISIF